MLPWQLIVHNSMIEFGAMLGARFLAKPKPALRNIPHAFQLPLHFRMLGFHEL